MSRMTRRQFIGVSAGVAISARDRAAPAGGLIVNPRSAWAAGLPPLGPLEREDVRFLIVHHSASHNGHGAGDVPAILRSWFELHTTTRSWNDIAYNFVIDATGGVWEARQGSLDGPVAGDATGGNQGFTQLVCLIGDFNATVPTKEAMASLTLVLAWLADRYDVPTTPGAEVTFTSRGSNRWPAGQEVTTPTICGHRDMSETTCPGDNLYGQVVGSLPVEVEAMRAEAATTTTVTTAAPATTFPAATTVMPAMASTMTTAGPPSTLEAAVAAGTPPTGLPGWVALGGGALLGIAGLAGWRARRMSNERDS